LLIVFLLEQEEGENVLESQVQFIKINNSKEKKSVGGDFGFFDRVYLDYLSKKADERLENFKKKNK
jgi:hypothetical protein